MKKTLVVLLMVLVSAGLLADFTWGQLNFYEGIGVSNPYGGETYNLTYFEIEGGGRTGILNFYYFVDVENLLGIKDELKEDKNPGSYFMKINPRFSLTKLMNKEACFGPIKESYLALQYKGYSSVGGSAIPGYWGAKGGFSGENFYVGLGTDLAIPFFDMFSFNFYKMFQHINDDSSGDWEVKFEDAGWVAAINWFTVVKKFNEKFNLSYQGWSDFGFGNTYAEDGGGVTTEWQMFNGFFWNYDKWSVSTSVKFHNNFLYTDLETHDAISPWIGLHRRF